MIASMMRTASYASYGFVGFFLVVAICSSGKNRQCLGKCKIGCANVMCLIVLIIIIMAILYFITLFCAALIGIPLTIGTMSTQGCKVVMDEANGIPCLSTAFLGSTLQNLCRDSVNGAKLLKNFCHNMDQVSRSVQNIYFIHFFVYINH